MNDLELLDSSSWLLKLKRQIRRRAFQMARYSTHDERPSSEQKTMSVCISSLATRFGQLFELRK